MFGRLALLVALVAAATAHKCIFERSNELYKETVVADKDYLYKQRFVYDVLSHYNHPKFNKEFLEVGKNYDLKADIKSYDNEEAVEYFLKHLEFGLIPHDAIYSVYYYPHETYSVYKVLAAAKDFATFYKAALYFRLRVNHDLFAYAFSLAVIHRPDTEYVRLPPLYEIMPYMFYNSELLEKAHHYEYFGKKETHDGHDVYVIPYNYSGHYLNDRYDYNYENLLNYLTEDVAWNEYYFYFRNEYPFLLTSEESGLYNKYRGEQYLYGHKQIMARYLLERLGNNLGLVEHFNYNEEFYAGYHPSLSYPNSLPFPSRPDNAKFPKHKKHDIEFAKIYETRIMDAVDSGYILSKDGKLVSIYTAEGLNLLGNVIEGNADSYNSQFYGNVDKIIRRILGFNYEPSGLYKAHPSALEHFTTSMRDPAFYRLYFKILHAYEKYQENLGPYKTHEIQFPDFKIESVETNELVTFFEAFDSSINYGMIPHEHESDDSVLVKARQYRLNHEPFNVTIAVNAKKATKASVKIFLAPKFDLHDNSVDFNERHDYIFEIDNFIYDLEAGSNTIVREHADHEVHNYNSSEAFYTKIVQALESEDVAFQYDQHIYDFPERLVLPKGHANGFPLQVFVYVAPVEGEPIHYTSRVFGEKYIDNRPFGFPFNRPVINHDLTHHSANFFHKDVKVYHRE